MQVNREKGLTYSKCGQRKSVTLQLYNPQNLPSKNEGELNIALDK